MFEKIKIGIKNVRNIKRRRNFIETETEKDLDNLIQQFKDQDSLKEHFNINKSTARRPHIICFDVSADTEEKTLLDSLHEQFSEGTQGSRRSSVFDVAQDTSDEKRLEDLHSQFSEEGHGNGDFHINHHFNSKRGVNWIVEDFVPVTPSELEAVIEGIKPKKASGIDGLPREIVKVIFYSNPVWFTSLFNFSSGHFPHLLKWARIVLLPKEVRYQAIMLSLALKFTYLENIISYPGPSVKCQEVNRQLAAINKNLATGTTLGISSI
ncbi:hypothetical protein CEXT_527161 [Caerostris extrusa]|uniref:Reverse transcriptase n=1 Tax=Caerostris extrusa TaxID=172846 RepID=A0AAV4X6W6_CAEEX|nr:hypothetical protein CEXT_527161 [Caerostris extrusa]